MIYIVLSNFPWLLQCPQRQLPVADWRRRATLRVQWWNRSPYAGDGPMGMSPGVAKRGESTDQLFSKGEYIMENDGFLSGIHECAEAIF